MESRREHHAGAAQAVLFHRFGRRILTPVDKISAAVNSQLSSVTPGSIYIDVEVESGEKGAAKKEKTTVKKKVDFWCIDHVADELILELNSIGKTFLRRRIAGRLNTIWILLSADKGSKLNSSFKMGFILLNQLNPLSPFGVRLIGMVHGPDTREVLHQTVMTPRMAVQLAELKKSMVVHVVSADKGSDAVHGCLVVPKEILVAATGRLSSPPLVFLGDHDTLRTTPGHEGALASECIGVLAVRDGFIVGLVVFHCKIDRSLALRIATAGGCFTLKDASEGIGTVVGFYGLAESIPRGGVVFVETLNLAQKLTADHELFRVVFGLQAGNPRRPCWACEIAALDARRGGAPAEDLTHASFVRHAALYPLGAGPRTNA